MRGKTHYRWKGGVEIHNTGYVLMYAPNHPRAHKNKVFEHIMVMEKHLGRYLLPKERIHHINGVKTDNRIENLELFESQSQHMSSGHRHTGKRTHSQKCVRCGSYEVHKSAKCGDNRQTYHCLDCKRYFNYPLITRQEQGLRRRIRNNVHCPECNDLMVKSGKRNNKQCWECNNCKNHLRRYIRYI